MITGTNLGLSLTLNLEQYEDLVGDSDEAGVVVCTIIYSFIFAINVDKTFTWESYC